MSNKLAGVNLAFVGGDERELILLSALAELKARMQVVGFEKLDQLPDNLNVATLEEALPEAQGVILPMTGTDEKGMIRAVYGSRPVVLTKEHLVLLQPGTPIFVGVAKDYLKDLARSFSLPLIEVAERDDVAILNSIPTAEGAIEIALRETVITIHGSKCLIFGFGRIGVTLARMLKGLGAEVLVVARKRSDLARAFEQGHGALDYEEAKSHLSEVNVVFNTVPHLVITREYLERLGNECIIIDLATAPGGTDFPVAESLGIKAILAPGLPGKVAPKTAGQILAHVYPQLLVEQLNL